MQLIFTHENADFDAVASLLAAHKLFPESRPVLSRRLNQNVSAFLAVFGTDLPFATHKEVENITPERIILVDTQRVPSLKSLPTPNTTPVYIVDHHPIDREFAPHEQIHIEPIGANITLLIEMMATRDILISEAEATLFALGLYEDTGSFTYSQTTPRDLQAGSWLLSHGIQLDTIRQFLVQPLNETQRALFQKLRQNAQQRLIHGYDIVVSVATVKPTAPELRPVVQQLRDSLAVDALCILIETAHAVHLICRSSTDAIDVSLVAKHFGGGGHRRASAGTIEDVSLEDLQSQLWDTLEAITVPAQTIQQIMSLGIKAFKPSDKVSEISGIVHRVGHEGFPVIDNGNVVGLLSRREIDRAVEHGLTHIPIRDLMTSGNVTIAMNQPITDLVHIIAQTGWGQVPVTDDAGAIIGIVTRTDLIKFWASQKDKKELPSTPQRARISVAEMAKVLGNPIGKFIQLIAQEAQSFDLQMYLVGGVIRDVLLKRRNDDLDFVVEQQGENAFNAPAFAHYLQNIYGGDVQEFKPFATAKWRLNEAVAQKMGLKISDLPHHIDFATARNEFYEQPTALPSVYTGSIKLDLQRRDFTINTLAVQLSPLSESERLINFFNGVADLKNKQIRALHSLSFVDDPTRILRAERFAHRFGFEIEPRTDGMVALGLPMLGRTTGERIRHELDALLKETSPEIIFKRLQARAILTAIHPEFILTDALAVYFEKAREYLHEQGKKNFDLLTAYWYMIAIDLGAAQTVAVFNHLLFPHKQIESMQQASSLFSQQEEILSTYKTASELTFYLEKWDEASLRAVWIASENIEFCDVIDAYLDTWRHIQPETSGNTLIELGLKPSPCFQKILRQLRTERLDKKLHTLEDEQARVQELLNSGVCHDKD